MELRRASQAMLKSLEEEGPRSRQIRHSIKSPSCAKIIRVSNSSTTVYRYIGVLAGRYMEHLDPWPVFEAMEFWQKSAETKRILACHLNQCEIETGIDGEDNNERIAFCKRREKNCTRQLVANRINAGGI